jgi:hypothetical protein
MNYLPIRVNTAAPMASRPIIMLKPGMLKPSKDKPKRRKNNIVHQAASEFGVLIFILLWEDTCRLHESAT